MSSNFDWKTEEDFNWDKPVDPPPPEPSSGAKKRWLKILAVLLLISGAAALLVRQVNQRVDENREAMRSDIVSTHNLLRVAEEEQDDELFFSLLSGRDSSWTAVQHELFQSQSLRNRVPFGLSVQPGEPLSPEEDDAFSITFSPDMISAEVTTLLPYQIEIGNGLTDTVMLQETSLYRLGRERWLLSPPDEPFWGAPLLSESTHITLDYRQRDEEIATRLLPDLESKLEELCSQVTDIECDPDLQLVVTLSTDPQSLVDTAQPRAGVLTNVGLRINLPSPTLVGMPQDEAGYQALYRGYATQMATAVISQQVGYDCCEKLPFYQALLDYQMSQLALKPWPFDDAYFERILSEQIDLLDYAPLWQSDDPADIYGPDGWRVYGLVDFLLSTLPDSSPAMLQRELANRRSFRNWLDALFENEGDLSSLALINHLTRGFWGRGYEQALNIIDQWEGVSPVQDLYLTCVAAGQEEPSDQIASLYRYDMGGDAWQTIYSTPNSLWATSLPGDDLLLQQEYSHESGRWNAVLRQNEALTPLLPVGEDFTVSFGQTDPQASGLAAFVFPADSEEATITWFDLLNCDSAAGCPNQEIPGIPLWAPDGHRALFMADPNSQFDLLRIELRTVLFYSEELNDAAPPFYLGERLDFLGSEPVIHAQALAPAGRGYAPFWLDDNTFGYVTGAGNPTARGGSRVMTVSLDDNEPQLLFSLSDLLEGFEANPSFLRQSWIQYLMVHPDNPDRLFVMVFSAEDRRAHLLRYDHSSGEVQDLLSSGFMANHTLSLSPDSRFLVLGGTKEAFPASSEESALLQVYDLQRDEVMPFLSPAADFPPFATYDWSLDGQWLALLLDNGLAGIFSPESRQLRLIATPEGECENPAWTN